jgi:thioredoxin-like negative regulator of GroEL
LGALAYLSHETGYPSRKKLAQALRASTAEPNHLLLAAELFQMSGYYQESAEMLEDLYSRGVFLEESEKDQRVALRYGDALLVEDRISEAKRVWRSIPQELSMMRHILAMLNEEVNAHAKWPHNIPFLYRIANSSSSEPEARLEAMYLIAQINTILDSRMQAMRAWKKMLLDFSDVGRLSDAGANLWALYYLEVMDLQEKQDWGDIIELHEEIWFDGMLEYALDPQVFQHVIDAYMNFGFEDEAISLTRKLRPQQKPYFTEEEEARSFLTTAKIYQKKEKGTGEALATLDLISTKNISAKTKNEIEILRAELLLEQKKYEEAVQVLKRVKKSRQFRLQAQYLLGVAYAAQEDCVRNVQEVQPSILSQSTIDKVFSIVHMDGFADCSAQQGKINDAVAYLEYAKIQDITDKERARINYLISEYDGRNFEVPPGSEEEKYLWNKLLKEKEKNKMFTQEFEKWKSESK